MPELWGGRSVRLPQHHLRWVLHVGNKQKSLRRGRIWSIARQGLQWSNRLNDAPPVGICFQDCEWLKLPKRRVIGFRQIDLVSGLRRESFRRNLNQIQEAN